MNAKDAFNYSRLHIVKASELVEPAGWYLGREYYVVTKGLAVGIFHDLSVFIALLPVCVAYTQRDRSEVHRSVDPFPLFRLWETCKVWQDAVKMWDIACRTPGAVCILRKGAKGATVTTAARASTVAPAARCHVCGSLLLTSTTSSKLPLVLKRGSAIIISDSDSDGDGNVGEDSDSDSEVETTSPKAIKKRVDCFDLTDDENGSPILRKTYDALTDTYLDAPTKNKTSIQGRTAPRRTTFLKHHKSSPPFASGSGYKSPSATSMHPSQSHA